MPVGAVFRTLGVSAMLSAQIVMRAGAQVTRTDQASGTEALLIAVSPVNENVVWVSGAQGTWLRTLDGGASWQSGRVPGADSLQFRDVHAVDANTAYLLSIGNGAQSRIYKTIDGGQNWTQQFTNSEPQGFYDCFDFWDANRGIVIGDAIDGKIAMLTTSNGGATWTRVPPETLPAAPNGEGSFAASGTCVETVAGGHVWIVASNPQQGRILHSADYGRTWNFVALPITTREGTGPQSVGFRDARNGMALGGGNSAQPGDSLTAVTTDGGRTWVAGARPPLARGVWGGVYVPGTNPATIVAVSPSGAVYSRDEGTTWTALDQSNYWSVGFASRNAGWAVGARGRITKLSGF
ncbi:MAG: WD40/YVTN/BNR-like repeat-containing protein [Longimicrobiales bacterium]